MLAFSFPIVSTKAIEIVWSNWLAEIECITRDGGNWSSYRVDENVSGCSTAQEIASVFLTKNSHGPRHQGKQHCQSERIPRERVAGDINIHRSSNDEKYKERERERKKCQRPLESVFNLTKRLRRNRTIPSRFLTVLRVCDFFGPGIFAISFI